jgi:tetratricopeptide (TPR) repeat protein
LAASLGAFWILRGYFSEGYHWLTRAVEGTAKADSMPGDLEQEQLRAQVLLWQGRLAPYCGLWEQSRSPLAEAVSLFQQMGCRRGEAAALLELGWEPPGQLEVLQKSLDLFRALGDRPGIGLALDRLSVRCYDQGDVSRARQLAEEGIDIERALGRTTGLAWLLNCAGLAASGLGELEQARALFQESLEAHRELGNTPGIATALANLSDIFMEKGDLGTARALINEAQDLFRQLGNRPPLARMMIRMGDITAAQRDHEAARRYYLEAQGIGRDLGDTHLILSSLLRLAALARAEGDDHSAQSWLIESLTFACEARDNPGIGRALESFAALALLRQHHERAAQLLGAADAVRQSSNSPRPPTAHEEFNNTVSTARAALGEAAFTTAWAAGQAMSPMEVVEYARAGGDPT